METYRFLRITPEHRLTRETTTAAPKPDTIAAMLDTDVIETLRIPNAPIPMLCMVLDARSGDRALPHNFYATGLFLNNSPIYGSILLAKISQEREILPLLAQETDTLTAWLQSLFGHTLQGECWHSPADLHIHNTHEKG